MNMEGSSIEALRPKQQNTGPSGAANLPIGPRCAAIITANPASRLAGLEAAAVAMANGSVTSVRVNNPLNSPLTLQRILIQMDLDGGEDDADADDEARLVRLLTERRGAQSRIVLVVERAETLDPAALPPLQRIASPPGAVHILFVGGPAFWALLDPAELAPLRRALTGQGTAPAEVAPPGPVIPVTKSPIAPVRPPANVSLARPVDPMTELRPVVSARTGRRWWIVGAIGVVAIVTLGATAVFAPGGLFYYAVPQRDMPMPPDRGRANDLEQSPVPLRPAPPMPPVTAPAPAALSQQPATPALPPTGQAGPLAPLAPPAPPPAARSEPTQLPHAPIRETEALTNMQGDSQSEQSLSWRLRDTVLPAPPSFFDGRIVIHYRGGSGTGEAEAARLAAVAALLADKVQTRVVADTPSAPVVRFFHPEDADRARQLADALSGSGPRWAIRDFSSFRPSPSLGTIEVWTPAR